MDIFLHFEDICKSQNGENKIPASKAQKF